MSYEQRYCDAKSVLSNFILRNVITVIDVVVDFVRLQYPSREALAIKPKSLPVSDACGWHTHIHREGPVYVCVHCLASVER